MRPGSAKFLLLLFLVSLSYTLLIQHLNIHTIRKQNPTNDISKGRALVHNNTVFSVDNYWYVYHIKNLLKFGRFTVDIGKDRYEVRRTPVYPLFYGVHYYLFGEAGSYRYIRYTQAVILALAVVALFLAMYNFTGSHLIAGLTVSFFGFFPTIPGYTSYTLTEALSPELVCFTLYFLSRCKRQGSLRDWLFAGFFFALASLCRPTVVFLALSVAYLIYYTSRDQGLKQIFLRGLFFSLGALFLFAPWTIRNYKVSGGDIVFLEKYYDDPMDYGMPNIHLRQWISCWTNPADFTSEGVSNLIKHNIYLKAPVDSVEIVAGLIRSMPDRAFHGNSRQAVEKALHALYAYYAEQMTPGQPHIQQAEQQVNKQLITLAENFRDRAPFDYYAIRPLIFLKSVIFQSHASALAFLDDYQNNLVQKGIKILMYAISVLSWAAAFVLIFRFRKYEPIYPMSALFVFSTSISIIILLSYFEGRYNIPAMPLLFGMLAMAIVEVRQKLMVLTSHK